MPRRPNGHMRLCVVQRRGVVSANPAQHDSASLLARKAGDEECEPPPAGRVGQERGHCEAEPGGEIVIQRHAKDLHFSLAAAQQDEEFALLERAAGNARLAHLKAMLAAK